MLEYAILGIIVLAGLALLGATLHKRLGPSVWPFLIILVPACLILIAAEAEVARGALAILLGSLFGAYGIALIIALAMLLAAHWLGEGIIEYLADNADFGGSRYLGSTWRPNRLAMAAIAFIMLAVVYGFLGYIRTGVPAGILGSTIITPVTRYIFFIYPVVSLIIGFFTALTIRAIKEHHRRWQDSQSACLTADVALLGRVSNNERRRIRRMIEQRVLCGESWNEIRNNVPSQFDQYRALTYPADNDPDQTDWTDDQDDRKYNI